LISNGKARRSLERNSTEAANEAELMPDSQLMQRVQGGDSEAFALLVQSHQRAVHAFLRVRLTQPGDAEDLTQEVFLRCYLARQRFDRNWPVRPWLLGIARNLLRERIRDLKRRKEVVWTELCLDLEAIGHFSDAQADDVADALPGCLETLGPSARQAIELRYRSEQRLTEIGQLLRRSEGAVKLLMHRARLALKECLERKLRQSEHDL
jgi:RNA polymerase sigma-70 factor, ECF subfamily